MGPNPDPSVQAQRCAIQVPDLLHWRSSSACSHLVQLILNPATGTSPNDIVYRIHLPVFPKILYPSSVLDAMIQFVAQTSWTTIWNVSPMVGYGNLRLMIKFYGLLPECRLCQDLGSPACWLNFSIFNACHEGLEFTNTCVCERVNVNACMCIMHVHNACAYNACASMHVRKYKLWVVWILSAEHVRWTVWLSHTHGGSGQTLARSETWEVIRPCRVTGIWFFWWMWMSHNRLQN